MRFATWNLDWWHRNTAPEGRADLLGQVAADVVALQEVSSVVARPLGERHAGPCVFSQDVHPEATWRWMGCGLLFPPAAQVLEVGLVQGLPKPQRSLWARVELPHLGRVTVVSWHTPNAAGDGREVKMAAYETMSGWLADVTGPVMVGADLNTWRDPVDLVAAVDDDPFAAEHRFVGPAAAHGLVDAYRATLKTSGELERLWTQQPDGPLAVSYVLASGTGHRMDRILVSPEFTVDDAAYLYDEAIAAGSDHALHWAELALAPPGGRS